MSRAFFFMADGRVQADVMPPADAITWERGDFPRQFSSLSDALSASASTLTVRTYERSSVAPDLWFEVRPCFCDIGMIIRRYGRLMSAALVSDALEGPWSHET